MYLLSKLKNNLPALIFAASAPLSAQAQTNPIDCEILLCMSGGFPAASGCTPALAEVIRRVSPWPIEPPLQIWNCPLSIPSQYGEYHIDLSAPEYEFAGSFRVYDIRYKIKNTDHGYCYETGDFNLGFYDIQGAFHWAKIDLDDAPDWTVPATDCPSKGKEVKHRGVGIEWLDESGHRSEYFITY